MSNPDGIDSGPTHGGWGVGSSGLVALVRRLDGALDGADRDSAAASYELQDAEALERYLVIRPEEGPRVRRLLGAGRLVVGPWYVGRSALLHGEVGVRNLLAGRRALDVVGSRLGAADAPDVARDHPGSEPDGASRALLRVVEPLAVRARLSGVRSSRDTVPIIRHAWRCVLQGQDDDAMAIADALEGELRRELPGPGADVAALGGLGFDLPELGVGATGAIASAVKLADDDSGDLVVRWRASETVSGARAHLRIAAPVRSVQRSRIDETTLGPAPWSDGSCSVAVAAGATVTLRVALDG